MSKQQKISSFFSPSANLYKRSQPFSSIENEPNTKLLKEEVDCNSENNSKKKIATLSSCGFSSSVISNDVTWKRALKSEFAKSYYTKLSDFVKEERKKHTIFPPENQVFSWMEHCNIRDVKVVILGQDPYHGHGQAHGLCFSVRKGVAQPPSLVNIFSELKSDINGFSPPNHGDLTGWANQGVLLLNAVLTVRASQANSHKDKGWETFTDAVVSWINANLQGVVFLLWGSYAQKKGAKINTKRHLVLKAVHPSPLSAYRGFFGCKHFSKTNEYLQKQGKSIIHWSKL